jgi:hypothetical protein
LLTTSSLFFGLSFFTASELLPSNGISSDEWFALKEWLDKNRICQIFSKLITWI